VRGGLADHWAGMLGLEQRQVNEGEEVCVVPERSLVKAPHIAH
jgi:hypothetical protein